MLFRKIFFGTEWTAEDIHTNMLILKNIFIICTLFLNFITLKSTLRAECQIENPTLYFKFLF